MYDNIKNVQEDLVGGLSIIEISNKHGIPVPSLVTLLPQVLDNISIEHAERSPFTNALNYSRLEQAIEKVLGKLLSDELDIRLLDKLAKALALLVKTQKEFVFDSSQSRNQKADKIINNQAIFISGGGESKPKVDPKASFLAKYGAKLPEGEVTLIDRIGDMFADDDE